MLKMIVSIMMCHGNVIEVIKSLPFLHPLFTPVVLVHLIVFLNLAHLGIHLRVVSIELTQGLAVGGFIKDELKLVFLEEVIAEVDFFVGWPFLRRREEGINAYSEGLFEE